MKLFTIGYEGLSQDGFLTWLRYFDINVVADVRELPLSRKKGFSKNGLSDFLMEQNIQYFSYRDLGVPKDKRNKLRESGDYKSFFRLIRKSINDKTDLLDNICRMIHQGKKVALLCYERDPEKCHRTIVADEVKKRDVNGLTIKHIKPL
ncbi:DUF488 family protein [Thermodesulfobacteriota bacterium]